MAMYGNLTRVATGPLEALSSPNVSMVGTGVVPEGINQNYIVYELMAEMGWRNESFDVDQWVRAYAHRRS